MSTLLHNMALNQESCISALEALGKETYPIEKDGVLWCNATWDSVLCWPAIPANTTHSMPCPPLKGLDTEKFVSKHCHASGRWMGRSETDFSNPSGWTDYISCMLLDHEAVEVLLSHFSAVGKEITRPENVTKHCHHSGHWMGKTDDDFSRPQGWTNFSSCMTPVVREILEQLVADAMQEAGEISKTARIVEFTGLALSSASLIIAILVLALAGRFGVFRNQLNLHLMLALLLASVTRLILFIDLMANENKPYSPPSYGIGETVHTTRIVCEAFYIRFEFAKTVVLTWVFIQALYLHDTMIEKEFKEPSKPWKYIFVGWGVPVVNLAIWFAAVVAASGEVQRCLGRYSQEIELWILDSVRLALILANLAFLSNVIRVVWCTSKMTGNEPAMVAQLKFSVITALLITALLVIPPIVATIPSLPTRDDTALFAAFVYTTSFFNMSNGFMIAIVCCIADREFISAIRRRYCRRGQASAGVADEENTLPADQPGPASADVVAPAPPLESSDNTEPEHKAIT